MGNLALEEKDYKKALSLHNIAYQLYQQIHDKYSQAALLYYRSFVHEAMNNRQLAVKDIQQALAIAQAVELPFIDLFEQRLEKLQS